MPHGADRGILRLLCTVCQGTAYCGGRAQEAHDLSVMRALAEGHAAADCSHLPGADSTAFRRGSRPRQQQGKKLLAI
jgi:hypothetical protein